MKKQPPGAPGHYVPTTGAVYYFSPENHSSRAWYVGASLGVALRWQP